mgnify:CR=1 FL=1
MPFHDRHHAGRLLAAKLDRFRSARPVVLGLTRGGVPVAFEIARSLGAPLDVLVVRKIGAPGSPEYAIGAIAEGGAVYVRRDALAAAGVGEEDLAELADREVVELARRVRLYRQGRSMPDLTGRAAIVVDDGVATGATAHAAARAVRARGATRVVLAAPVIAAASEAALRVDFDDVVAVEFPDAFFAVSQFYGSFPQVSDDEVLELLRHAPVAAQGEPEADAAGGSQAPAAGRAIAETLAIASDGGPLTADLVRPADARGLVVFVHGSGSTRRSPRNRFVAGILQRAGFATLLLDLLTPEEAAADDRTGVLRFDVDLLAGRVLALTRAVLEDGRTRGLRLGYFGASTGAAAALAAAAELPDDVAAVVSRGGRPDLVAHAVLRRVRAPVLLVVGGHDETVLRLNRSVLPHLRVGELAVVPGATHLFEEPGTLEAVARLASGWFERCLRAPVTPAARPPATGGGAGP